MPAPEPRYFVAPSVVWPSDNEYGIPALDPAMQAAEIAAPVLTWGNVPRTTPNAGTWVFYTQDYRYTALWTNPKPVAASGCRVAVEPNFSCYEDMPLAVGLWRIYQKRWLARLWQQQGIRTLVDLNVAPKFADLNLLGVPPGWRAYCTRGYLSRLDQTEREFERACERAGTADLLFVVYGGSKKLRDLCWFRGWQWIGECMDVRKRAVEAYG